MTATIAPHSDAAVALKLRESGQTGHRLPGPILSSASWGLAKDMHHPARPWINQNPPLVHKREVFEFPVHMDLLLAVIARKRTSTDQCSPWTGARAADPVAGKR
jgi:hypothetical protein